MVFEMLLDVSNTSLVEYADRGCSSIERETDLKQTGWRIHIQHRKHASKGISETQKTPNHRIATPRAGVGHIFGALA